MLIDSGAVPPLHRACDSRDLELLEARDLLFARLLQYRAFKEVAAYLASRLDAESARHPRTGGLEDAFLTLLPEVELTVDGYQLAWLAARALQPKEAPAVSLAHLHAPAVSVREQARLIVDRLRRATSLTFRALTADSPDRVTTVARFLALLELFREGAVGFEQVAALGELNVRWTGSTEGDLDISDEFDSPDSAPGAPAASEDQ